MGRFYTIVARFVAVALTLALCAIAGVYGLSRASLPQVDGVIALEGAPRALVIARDAMGVPTVSGPDEIAVAYGTGYSHAQDRFFQMDFMRRHAAGELAEVVGSLALPFDRRVRIHGFRKKAQQIFIGLPARHRQLLEAYTAGVNAAIQSLRVRPIEYVVLWQQPAEWSVEDALLVAFSMYLQTQDGYALGDEALTIARDALTEDGFRFLSVLNQSPWETHVSGASMVPAEIQIDPPAKLYAGISWQPGRYESGYFDLLAGSNAWALRGYHTAGNEASLVANDMHMSLASPNILYRIGQEIRERRRVDGVSIPGLPVIVAGSNGHVSLGLTNMPGKWSQLVVPPRGFVETARPREEVIKVRWSGEVTETFLDTRYGPLKRTLANGDLKILRWIAHMPSAVNLNLWDLWDSKNVSEVVGFASELGMPVQNFVIGDADGNIAWTAGGYLPRSFLDGTKSLGMFDYQRLSPKNHPHLVNPDTGMIVSANHSKLSTNSEVNYSLSVRAHRIRSMLGIDQEHDIASFQRIQLDVYAPLYERWWDLFDQPSHHEEDSVLHARESSSGFSTIWSFRECVVGSIVDPLRGALTSNSGVMQPIVLAHFSRQLEEPVWRYVSWKTDDEVHTKKVNKLVNKCRESAMSDVPWSSINEVNAPHLLFGSVPILSNIFSTAHPGVGGVDTTVRVSGPGFGQVVRFIVAPGSEAAGVIATPLGQASNVMSPFYNKAHATWCASEYNKFQSSEVNSVLRFEKSN